MKIYKLKKNKGDLLVRQLHGVKAYLGQPDILTKGPRDTERIRPGLAVSLKPILRKKRTPNFSS